MPIKKIEALLFAVGKVISVKRLSELSNLEEKEVEKLLHNLQSYYNETNRSIHLIEKENGWKLTVKDEYIPLVSNLVSATEFDRSLMETLAIIAWKYPVVQSEIIKLRGTGAYEHMKRLQELGFVKKERFGRTYKLRLAKKFFNYFDLPSEEAKKAFLEQIPKNVLDEAEIVDKEADEVERLIELEKKEKESKSEIEKAMQSTHE